MTRQLLNGQSAAMLAAQALSERLCQHEQTTTVPIQSNIWGHTAKVTLHTHTQDPASHLHAALQKRLITAATLSSDSLLAAIPDLYKIKTGVTVHVAAGHGDEAASFADFGKVMNLRDQKDWAMLSSSSVQEAYDLSIIAQVVAVRANRPVLHFYDSKRVSHEYATVQTVDHGLLSQLLREEHVAAFKQSAEETTATTAYLQYKNSPKTNFLESVATAVREVMAEFATLTGRQYSPIEYSGHPDAEHVIVAMGAGAAVAKDTLHGEAKRGVLHVRLYRPWSNKDLLAAIPKTVRRIAVLEPVHNPISHNPLFLDVVGAFVAADTDQVDLVSGQYGVNARDFSPRHATAVFSLLEQATVVHQRFAVDELVLPPVAANVSDKVEQLILVGDETRAQQLANKAFAARKTVQLYTVQVDNTPVSHLRIAQDNHARLVPSLIDGAATVVLNDPAQDPAAALDAVSALAQGGVAIVLSETSLPEAVKKTLAVRQAKVATWTGEQNLDGARQHATAVPETWLTLEGALSATKPTPRPGESPQQPVETPYLHMLDQVFAGRLEIANATHGVSGWAPNSSQPEAATPEYGYGKLLNTAKERARFQDTIERAVTTGSSLSGEVTKALSNWLLAVKSTNYQTRHVQEAADAAVAALEAANETELLAQRDLFHRKSSWLVGSDAWAYDLGQSGVHHVIASGENTNLLIIDTQPYSTPDLTSEQRKKDIGLYAMNFGNVYVASVALYSSYTGVLHALMEADAYQGPSIVLAYLPQSTAGPDAIGTLKETKLSVDSGAWPLYRWNPDLERQGKEPFTLDSQRIKKDLEKFLERENHFSQLVSQHPDLSTVLVSSLESDVTARHEALKRKARDDYAKLLSGLSGASGPPLTVLFGSDNGNAEGLAKKIATRAKSRGLQVKWMAMDDYSDVQDLAGETNVVFVVSTAGQGELPSNAREFWKALNGLVVGDVNLGELRYGVFGLGDSHYWPREEDAIFYNKPGKLLDAKLETLGATRLVDLGLGDDQDADGFETGFQSWQPDLWKALGVRDAGAEEEEPKLTDDQMKINSNFLRGTIAEDLRDESTGAISEINGKLLKFHGSYGQDDRDLREQRKKQGLEKAYSFMIRVRMPGGVSTSEQWLAMDKLAGDYANGALKLTTRQAFQLHGILKKDLRTTIRGINQTLLSTLAACGDVNRNIMITPVTEIPEVHEQVQAFGTDVMHRLAPQTNAYHEIWLADELVAGHAVQDVEPIYGPTYLPRKFKIVIAVPPNNDVDIYAHDLGFIAIVDPATKQVIGYNVTIGGGMGMTHGNKKTYPRPASMLGYVPAAEAVNVAEHVMTTQRDYGDRTNRKHARFKYTIDDHGLDFIKAEIEKRSGLTFEEARPFEFKDNADRYGWTKGTDDKWHFCMFIENGKVKDWPDFPVRTGLRELAMWHKGEFRLSPNQHLVIANVPEADLERTKAHLAKYKMDNLAFTGLRLNAMACVALPTCGLAMAESERYLPTLVSHLEEAIEVAGLRDDAITIRMTGCPNGCARPYLAELAFVGKAPGAYNVYLGGGHRGERLNKLYKESLREEEILDQVKPIIKRYALERHTGEPFGDWVIRAGFVKQTITGKDFHDL